MKIVRKSKKKQALNKAGNRRGMAFAGQSQHMKLVRQRRTLWNKKLPVLSCDNCAFVSQCPQYRAGFECSFKPFLRGHRIRDEKDLMTYARSLVAENLRRAQQTMIMETLSGGMPGTEATEQFALVFNQLVQLHTKLTEGPMGSITVEREGVVARLFGKVTDLYEHVAASKIAARNSISVREMQSARADEVALAEVLGDKETAMVEADTARLLPAPDSGAQRLDLPLANMLNPLEVKV